MKYAAYARVASWADSKMPGTGPEMSEMFARVIVEPVMPVWFLRPSQLPALVVPVAEFAPVPWLAPPAEPPALPVDPVPVPAAVPPPASAPAAAPGSVVPGTDPSWATVPLVPCTAATSSGSRRDPQAARASESAHPHATSTRRT